MTKFRDFPKFSEIWCEGILRFFRFSRKARQGKAIPYQKIKKSTETAGNPEGLQLWLLPVQKLRTALTSIARNAGAHATLWAAGLLGWLGGAALLAAQTL